MFKAQFVESTRAAVADALPSISLLDFCRENGCEPSKVCLTRENKYKCLILKETATGRISCILFGKKSADTVKEGDAPRHYWSVVQLESGMFRISTSQQQHEGFESLYA